MYFVVVVFLTILALMSIRIVRPYEEGLIERLGKYQRTAKSGLNLIIPIIDTMIRIDMRERAVDVRPQKVITKDNANVTVDAVVYYEITDPQKVIYNISNFHDATEQLAKTNLRNLIGGKSLDETLTSRGEINDNLRKILDKATDKWGAKITRVELQKVEPPSDITEAMHKQMKAERTKRAEILKAEGFKQSDILQAEGSKKAAILEAEGKAGAIRAVADAEKYEKETVAKGEKEAIKMVYAAIHEGKPTADLITIKYLESLIKIADGKANKVFLPLEATGIMGAIGGVGELLKEKIDLTLEERPKKKVIKTVKHKKKEED